MMHCLNHCKYTRESQYISRPFLIKCTWKHDTLSEPLQIYKGQSIYFKTIPSKMYMGCLESSGYWYSFHQISLHPFDYSKEIVWSVSHKFPQMVASEHHLYQTIVQFDNTITQKTCNRKYTWLHFLLLPPSGYSV